MIMEIWKDIKGFEDYYQISNMGNIKRKQGYVNVCGNGKRFIDEHLVKPNVCKNGYLEAMLNVNGKRKAILLHRLVAAHFIENPYNLPEVNHKDENVSNCCVDNLEWCTSKYNANYGTRNKRCRLSNKNNDKSVIQYDLEGNFIKKWDSIADAMRSTGANDSAIIRVCKNKQNTAMGYKWKYAEVV